MTSSSWNVKDRQFLIRLRRRMRGAVETTCSVKFELSADAKFTAPRLFLVSGLVAFQPLTTTADFVYNMGVSFRLTWSGTNSGIWL